MAVVGEGTVIVRLARGLLRRDLRDELNDAERDSDASGERSGKNFAQSFGTRLRGIQDDVAARLRGTERLGGDSGDSAGSGYASRFSARLRGIDDSVLGMFKNWARAGDRGGDDAGGGFSTRFGQRLRGLDDQAGAMFRRMASYGDLSGDGAGRAFASRFAGHMRGLGDESRVVLDDAGNALAKDFSAIKIDLPDFGGGFASKLLAIIPLVGVLGGGIAALIGGLTALAASAAYAAGSFAILATGLGALVLGIGTAFLAFSPIIKAVQALTVQQNKAGVGATRSAAQQRAAANAILSAQQRVSDAAQGVQDAEYNLAQARHSAAEQNVTDAHNVQQAERSLADAQQRARDAQAALTQARKDAKSTLEDLQMQLRGSVLGEEEATLRLAKARQNYQKVLNDPNANALDRKQAELDMEDAELALDEAKKRRQDVTQQTEEANKKGVEGSDQVVKAKKDEKDANQGVKDAEYNLAQARQKAADDAVQNAHSIAQAQLAVARSTREVANAQRALADAYLSAKDGGAAATTAARNAQIALKNMSPDAVNFAKFILKLRPELTKLQTAAGAELFKPLQNSIGTLVKDFFPTLRAAVRDTGAGLASFFGSVVSALTSGGFLTNFANFANLLSKPRKGGSDWALMGKIIGNIIRGLTGLATAAEPVFRDFLVWVERVTGSFANGFEGKKNLDGMTASIKDMGKEAAVWGHVIGGIFTLLGRVMSAALPTGKKMTDDLAGGLDNLNNRLKDGKPEFVALQKFFEHVRGPFNAVIGFAGELGKQFMLLGANPGLIDMFNKLKDAMPTVEHAIETFTNKIAPPLIDIIRQIIDVFDAIASSPAMTVFTAIMKGLATVIGGFMKLLFAPKIRVFTGALLGMLAALVAINKILKVTGLKALYQSVKVGAAPADSKRARKATGLGGFIQGVRGNRVVDPDSALYEETVDPVTGEVKRKKKAGSEKARTSNRLGNVFGRSTRAAGRAGGRLDAAAGRGIGRVRDRIRSRRGGGGGGSGGFSTAGTAGAVSAVATVGLALAPAIMSGNIHGIGQAAHAIGQTLTANLDTFLITAAPGIISVLGKGLAKAAPHVASAAKSVGSFISKRIKANAGGSEGGFLDIKGFGRDAKKLNGVAKDVKVGETVAKDAAKGERVAGVFGKVSGAMKSMTGVSKIAQGAMSMMGPALGLLTNPITLVVAGIALLALGAIELYKHWKPFRDIVNDVGGALKTAAVVVANFVKNALDFMKDHLQYLLPLLGPFGVAILGVIEIFKHFDAVKKIISDVWGAITGFVTGIPGAIKGGIGALGNAIKSIGTTIWDKLGEGLRATGGFVSNVGDAIINTVIDFINHNVINPINSGLHALHAFGYRPFGAHTLPNIGRAGGGGSKGLPANAPGSLANVPVRTSGGATAYRGATGGTIAPRPGGTHVIMAEAGRPESIVDTGLINERLRSDAKDKGDVVAELRRVQSLLANIQQMGGINVEKLEVQAHKDERAAESVPRSLRSLAFEMGA